MLINACAYPLHFQKKPKCWESVFFFICFCLWLGCRCILFYLIYILFFLCCYCCWCCCYYHSIASVPLFTFTDQLNRTKSQTILNQNLIFRIQWIDKLITKVSYLLDYYQHMNESLYNIPRSLTSKTQFKHKTFKAFSTLPTELGFPIQRTTQTRNVEMKSS